MWIVVLDAALGNIRSEVETSVRSAENEAGGCESQSQQQASTSSRKALPRKFRAAPFPAEVREDVQGQWSYLFAVMPHGFFFLAETTLVGEVGSGKIDVFIFFTKCFGAVRVCIFSQAVIGV